MSHSPGGFDWIRSHYPVPAKRGGRIELLGKPARICSVSGGHLVVHIDGEPERRRHYAHPCYEIKYVDPPGAHFTDNPTDSGAPRAAGAAETTQGQQP